MLTAPRMALVKAATGKHSKPVQLHSYQCPCHTYTLTFIFSSEFPNTDQKQMQPWLSEWVDITIKATQGACTGPM